MIDQGVKMEALINTATASLENSVHCVLSLPWLDSFGPPSGHIRNEDTAEMCRFYAHTYQCGHTKTVFSKHCSRAALKQQACHSGDICANVQLDEKCSSCHKPVKILVQTRLANEDIRSMRA